MRKVVKKGEEKKKNWSEMVKEKKEKEKVAQAVKLDEEAFPDLNAPVEPKKKWKKKNQKKL